MKSDSSTAIVNLDWPLMRNNILREDIRSVIEFLDRDEPPILTQSRQVEAFEKEWSEWLGVKHSVFVNSGSSSNLITLCALRELYGVGEVIVPTLTWVSDIAAVLHAGMEPVFVDINPHTLGMDSAQVISKLNDRTRAVFLTHILGFNALDQALLDALAAKKIPLIEDVCESHGATFKGKKLGTYGLVSNFSFYYAHHLSTVEGGMICTDDEAFYEVARMFRSHGMVREMRSPERKAEFAKNYADLNPDFIFAFPAYNMRGTEIPAVMGRSQLKRLDANNEKRRHHFRLFLENLDGDKYRKDLAVAGSCNYAFTLILREA
ncbi:MAG: DegT/DnrJ/EryC1/StrS aminotransferase family protein, partial [Chthoniobacterales bacterium]